MKSSKGKAPDTALSLLLLMVVTLGCLLPFIGKAFHMDDPLFIWCARHIQSTPFNFYGFNVNWDGQEKPMAAVMQNPPLTAYYLALIGWRFGWSEMALHAGFLLPALAVILGTYLLARKFCYHPFAAALAVVATPAFLVSSTSVMSDTMMVAFWVWAMFFWIEGLKQNRPAKLYLAGLLIAACGLTKYFGFCLIPLLLVYSLLERRPVRLWLASLALPVVAIILYQWLTGRLYGSGLVLNAVSYATHLRVEGGLASKVLTGLTFSGGCMMVLIPAAPLLWGRKITAAGLLAVGLFGAVVVISKRAGSFPVVSDGNVRWWFVVQYALLAVAGISLLGLAALDWVARRTSGSALLFLWVTGTFIFACALNWTVSGRNILPLIPAASILLIRRLESRRSLPDRKLPRSWVTPMGISLGVALLVTFADYRLAGSARAAATRIQQELATVSSTVRFEGHWGFQYYMEKLGAAALDRTDMQLVPNEIVVVPPGNSYFFPLPVDRVTPWFVYRSQALNWLTTMNGNCGAGYYSDGWGPLPFVFGSVPAQDYLAFQVK